MFSPISVGAYIVQKIAGTGEDEKGAEDAKREDSAERNSPSGSDSDEGTSADTPGPGVPVNRALILEEMDCPIIESEIISSDTATEEFSIKQDDFAARLAVLPAADIVPVVDDKMTSSEDRVQDFMADRGGSQKDFQISEDTLPQDINTHKLHLNENRDDERPSQSGLRELDTTRDRPLSITIPDGNPLNHFSDTTGYEQDELHIDSDSDSGSDSSTTSGETMSTVKENTESRDFEDPGDVNEYNDKNTGLFANPAEDHVYIAPDLEFPFHKSTLQTKESIDIKDILENMDKKSASEPQKEQEVRHIPKSITDEELENALKILRSGRPPAQRSWYSLDNISNTKPTRTFALYYTKADTRRRRNSAGDEDDCISLPEKNSILGFPDTPDEHSALYYVNDQWKFDELHIPDTPSEEEFALPGSTIAQEVVPMGLLGQNPEFPVELTLKSDKEVQRLPPSEVDKKPIHEPVQERPQNPHISQLADQKTIPKTTMKSSPVNYSTPSPETSVGPSKTSPDPNPDKVTRGSVYPVRAAVYPVTERPTFFVQSSGDDDSMDPKQESTSSVSDECPMSPEPYISASVKYPQTFHPPIAPKPKFSKHNIKETEQYPVLSMKQKEIEFAELENILPEKQKYPPLPPKPSFLKKKIEKENPIVPSLITQEESRVDLSVFEAKTPNNKNQDELKMSPEPYISASVKHQSVFNLPSLGTPVSMKVQPTYRGTIIVDEQYPVISTAQKELVLSELENLIPKQKVPPKVPPKPSFRKRVEVDQQPAVSTKVQTVQSSVDLSILEKREPSKETQLKRVPQTVTSDAGEEKTKEDEVVIVQAGISVYRQKPHEVSPTSERRTKFARSHSLQIPDTGEVSYVPAADNKHKTTSFRRSKSTEVTRMNASLSLHRLESGEHLTENVLSVHEQELEDVNQQTAESEKEYSPTVRSGTDEDKEDLAGEEKTKEDEVVIVQAGISAYRQKPHEVSPTSERRAKYARTQTLQIPDTGEVSFVPAADNKHKTTSFRRSYSTEVTRMNASLSLHRLESGEHLTENVLSVHEQELEDVNQQTAESEKEDSPIVRSGTDEDMEDLAGEEKTKEDEVVIVQAGISVYRQKPHEVSPTSERRAKYARTQTLQIPDTGEVSFVPAADNKHKTTSFRRSYSTEVTRMNASLSLHRLESGEHLTENVLSVHEQELEDVNQQTAESEKEDSPIVLSGPDGDKEDLNRLTDSERDGSRSGTEDSYQSSDYLPSRAESFHGSKIPLVPSVSDHFGSSSCSSPDEFLTVADITISKMEAAKNTHHLEDASSTSPSSDFDSSGSADSDDSSFESAEEHTYVVTECEDVFDSHYDEGHRSSLPQVLEEVDEEEEEESENSSNECKNDVHEAKQGIKMDLPEEGTHDTEKQRGEEIAPDKKDLRVSPTTRREQPVELTDTTNLDNIPDAVQRYPRYISMGKSDIKPQTEYALSKTVDLDSQSQPKLSWAYPKDTVAETALSDDEDKSSGNDEPRNKSELDENATDEPEHSEDMEEDFSEEYSDEPEWQPPPPSSGARVFVLTANMFRPTRVEPQAHETGDVPQEKTGNAPIDTGSAYEQEVKYIDDKEYRDYEPELVDQNNHELKPDTYFKPISDVMPSAYESTAQEKPMPVTVSNDPNSTSEIISQNGEPNNKPKDVKSVTVTYTVIHTRKTPTLGEIPSSPSEPRYENLPMINKDIDESTPQFEPYSNEPKSISAGTQQSKGTTQSGMPDENGTKDCNVEPLSNDNVPKYESDFHKYDEKTATKELHSLQDANTDDHLKSSKIIPVHEVGPYNYTSSEPKDNKPGNRETIVRKTELNSGVSVFSVSSRNTQQRQRPTQPDDEAEHRESGPYRFGSWYEEPTEDAPAMAIALVKRDIALPSEHLPVRETVVKPQPKPEPKVEPVVVNTEPTSPESREEGPYRYSAWYEEPTEEKEESADDVVVISSYDANDPNSPQKATPLSPVREPGSYTYSSWYEEPVDKPSEDNFFILSTPIASDEKSDSDALNSKKKSSDDTRSKQRYRPSDLYDDQPENIEEPEEEDTFIISKPFTETSQPSSKPNSNTSGSKATDSREMQYEAQYRFSTWYDEAQSASNEPTDTFTISRTTEETTRSGTDERSSSSSTRDSRESQFAGQYLYSTWSENTSPKEQSETFTISRPEEDTRPLASGSGDDLYYPRETASRTGLLVTDPTERKSSAGDSVSGTSSRKNSNSSSRTSGSLADVSATSGEAMRRTWSDDSEKVSGDDSRGVGSQSSEQAPVLVERMHAAQPPKPKPRLSKPSAPSSSDDEKQIKPRRQGRAEGKGQETSRNADEILSPKAEYALASSAWRQLPIGGSFQPPGESVVWDSGDDRRITHGDRGDHNRYSVTDKSRREIENMLDTLVPNDEFQEDTSSVSYNIRGDYSVPPAQQIDTNHGPTSQRRQDSSRSYVLPQAVNTQTSFKETRIPFTSEPHITRANAGMGQEPDFPEPILAARPQRDEQATTYPSNRHGRQNVPGEVSDAAPLSSRDEYKLAAASWENLSSTSDNGTFTRAKMETWDNDPDAISARQKLHTIPLAGHQRFQSAEPAPILSEEASVPPRGPKRNGLVITADIHAHAQPEPAIPHLAVQMLSASSSTAELAPPPPKDWGTPQKAHSAVGINQPLQKKPVSKSVIPDAEAVIHRPHRHRPPVKGLRPPSSGRSGRPSSPVSVSSYSSTQSLPARILPRLPRDNELEKLKHQLAHISKQIEIKTGELKQINLLNPSIKYHIPIRGRRGELISPDGRILSTPEVPNKRELEKYKKFFDRLPEADFRRLMHEILDFKNKVRHKEEEIKRLTNQCTGLRKRLLWLAQHEK